MSWGYKCPAVSSSQLPMECGHMDTAGVWVGGLTGEMAKLANQTVGGASKGTGGYEF